MAMTYRTGSATAVTASVNNPHTHDFTVGSSDVVLIVPIIVADSSGGGAAVARTGGTPTFAGVPLVQAGTAQIAAASPETSTEIWYLFFPPQGAGTISIPNTGPQNIRCMAMAGLSSTGGVALDGADGGNGTSTSPADTITTAANGCLIVGVCGSGATTWAPSAQTGTAIYNTDHGVFGTSVQYFEQASLGAQSVAWTFGISEDWAICSAAFKTSSAPTDVGIRKIVGHGGGLVGGPVGLVG